ncbi:hypothetical protein [Flavobacterium anhuiense]|uniref:hypothetical protein n=1 Tax=Flavobacterium anhuiense TaxID=459526 RepID=UPI003D981368
MATRNQNTGHHQFQNESISFEEQLLLNYDDYLQNSTFFSLKNENHYDIELEDLDNEYDENDWEEE